MRQIFNFKKELFRGKMGKQVRVDTSSNVSERDMKLKEQEKKNLQDELSKLRMELSQVDKLVIDLYTNVSFLEDRAT
jgi:hypothetical protein